MSELSKWATHRIEDYFNDTDTVIWRDGKPRCAQHPGRCLVRLAEYGVNDPERTCSDCLRAREAE